MQLQFIPLLLDAQQSLLFDKGRSWTVIIIMGIIWAGIAAYLLFQNQQIKKLEDRIVEVEKSRSKKGSE